MPFNCCVPHCSNNSKKFKGLSGLSFHCFPREESVRKQWIAAIRTAKKPTQFTKICSKHFEESEFLIDGLLNCVPPSHRRLKRFAVPTLFLPLDFGKPKRKKKTSAEIMTMSQENLMDDVDEPEIVEPQIVEQVQDIKKTSRHELCEQKLDEIALLHKKRVRRLQQINLRQKKEIEFLKAVIAALKEGKDMGDDELLTLSLQFYPQKVADTNSAHTSVTDESLITDLNFAPTPDDRES